MLRALLSPLLLSALGLLIGPLVSELVAGSGDTATVPRLGKKPRSGLRLEIDTRWVDGNGYRPVLLRLMPLRGGKSGRDRTVEVTFRPVGWGYNNQTDFVQTVELEQGQTHADVEVLIPQTDVWSQFSLEVHEDGRRLRDLSEPYMSMNVRNYYEWSEAWPTTVFIDSDAQELPRGAANVRQLKAGTFDLPDVRAFVQMLPAESWSNALQPADFKTEKKIDDQDIMRLVRDLPRIEILPPSSLPENWLGLSCFDLLVISLEDLRVLQKEHPQRWQAVQRWLRTGTVICVYGVGDDFEHLDELHTMALGRSSGGESPLAGWLSPRAENYGKPPVTDNRYAAAQWSSGFAVVEEGLVAKATKSAQSPPNEKPFVWRQVGEGQLVALASSNPFSGDAENWAWILRSVGENNWMWFKRNGLSMSRENKDYWNLTIPGVGEAPVNSFLFLITVFAIVIGPLNYVVLKRQNRLYLLLVTVPLGAGTITLGLLAFALLTDGFGTQMRIRSFTEIDQRSGHAQSWSRQTYYAGLAPGDGLRFPADAAVYPVAFRPHENSHPRRVVWGEQQHLQSGFVPSRTTVQYLVVESRETTAGLRILKETEDRLTVTNDLGTEVIYLAIHGKEGGLFSATDLSPGDQVELTTTTRSEISAKWTSLLTENRPAYPRDFDPDQMENFGSLFSNNYWNSADNSQSAPTFRHSIFERRLKNLTGQDLQSFGRRHYLAVVKQAPEVSVGLTDARIKESFQVIYGSW